ncbi:12149_t:CDS:1 [Ambispora gerdemannii]|uniref:12149_t:CDS:1 n=1 Tax=Ambispora gerdemannii TaxID=144530 RepID=A0A9N9GBQ4_9GLOM|nr:12149_t:CDS:1 [Ambispora gerdemannii]
MPVENLEQIVKDNLIQKPGMPISRVEQVIAFSTPLNENCAVVISKFTVYAVRTVIYDPITKDMQIKRYPDFNPVNGYTSLRKALRQVIDVKLEREVNDALEVNKSSSVSQEKLDNNVRNILLIGRTGSGKSTLANILTNTNKFPESELSVSETHDIQSEEIVIEGIKYCIIDTPGISNTRLPFEEVLKKIIEGACLAKDGLYQILFVTNGKLTQAEIEVYNYIRTIIFDEGVSQYTTLVRTHAPNFQEKGMLYDDLKRIIKENDELVELFRSCRDFIYVNNPSLKEANNIEIVEETRDASRKELMKALGSCGEKTYKAKGLNSLSQRIKESITKEQILQRDLTTIADNGPHKELLTTLYREKIEETKTFTSQEIRKHITEKNQIEIQGDSSWQRTPQRTPTNLSVASNISTMSDNIIGAIIQGLIQGLVTV